MNSRDRMRATPRLLMTLVILALLTVSAPAPLVSAEDTEDYTAAEIEQWLARAREEPAPIWRFSPLYWRELLHDPRP